MVDVVAAAMDLSKRTAQHDVPNALADAVRERRARGGASLLDLTSGNPTTVGLAYDEARILGALADPRSLRYAPEPLGLAEARAAVAGDWRARGVDIGASRIALTASTSEAYGVLFKMLADPGDEILVPAPSYPLLGFLAAFESVTLVPYPLVHAGGWHVDVASLARSVTPRTRAIVVVSPNNPTGSYLGTGELEAMLDLGLPIISDEVFGTYPLAGDGPPPGRVASVAAGTTRGLVFALSGLSKLAALPQLKLGWIAVAGDPELVAPALARLELVLDAYLSVATPVQLALPELLAARTTTEQAIRARTRQNLATLRARVRGSMLDVLDVEGGWYAILRVPETQSDEAWAIALARDAGVLVQPGYFFDMDRGAHLVVSLLTPEATFRAGIEQLATYVTEHA
ncbi:MAG: putative aminotransferase [Labilithrix sp.]|nr:putative aminotransferase [Labilithrix sp.]